ncbi:MAG: hypothetical protein M3Z92_03690 [Bacteroidota bacterium]|nr:hypothetical protein [Bacteroidota bacterium]
MKKTYLKNVSCKILLFATILFVAFSFSSCAKKMTFGTSSVVPAAEGSVKIKSDKNKNTSVDLNIMRLADPKRLDPPKDTYVVWMETSSNGTKNIGSLNTSSSLFSSTLKSSLKTVTPYKPTDFLITAENDKEVQYPNGQVVLKTN